MAALEDVLDRVTQQLSAEAQRGPSVDPPLGPKKRKLSDENNDEGPHRKRVKTSNASQNASDGALVGTQDNDKGTRKRAHPKGKGKREKTVKDDLQARNSQTNQTLILTSGFRSSRKKSTAGHWHCSTFAMTATTRHLLGPSYE